MPEWLKELASAGPALIFATLWWLERSERKAMLERALTAMMETKSALKALASVIKPLGRDH